jgi:hypothetical protein
VEAGEEEGEEEEGVEERAAGSSGTMLGPGRGADGRKAGRSRGRGGQGGGRGVTFEGEESPEHVELLELPPGVPELLPVVCNGHRAQLALRTQRVVYRGQEMAPSRFEAMAGATEGVQGACRGLGASWRLACMPVGSRAGVQDRLPLSWC